MTKVMIILGSTRPNNNGSKVADWLMKQAEQFGDAEFELVRLGELDLPMFNEPESPSSGNYVHQHSKDWAARVEAADAFIMMTPEYNGSYSAAIKNAIDYVYAPWKDKKVGIVSYGGDGGTKSGKHLSDVLSHVGMQVVEERVLVAQPWVAFDEVGDLDESKLTGSAQSMFGQLS